MTDRPVLTAALIARAHPDPVPDDAAAMPLLSEAETEALLAAALAAKPGPPDEIWLFAYGALMWRPEFPFAERRAAGLPGWHRRFCLWQWRFRGTRDNPGVMLALDRGGRCRGLAYRLAGPDPLAALRPVWHREMRGRGYAARWLAARTEAGTVPALAFVANRAGERYAGRLGEEAIAARIAAACGHLGPNAEYLLNTAASCAALGLRDRHLERLQALVAARLEAAARARAGAADMAAGAARRPPARRPPATRPPASPEPEPEA
ncbi:ChaC family protein [Methylobacterium sp. 4-46]|uniref:gamma-glutamylcyclotransferase n=1 Tax=unclassified Methylobacterium TaxID=2615210 RepID=UPI000152CF44|nr:MULTISPECIES: gamma-glutamylcyclotransferase [Methylobacterium]ACA20079.1 ChaC family protein [Methylobacterium sp. 4-46]WFT79266.1 gamma-glutamylcyclotransferase [Methylobacterium nodulans]